MLSQRSILCGCGSSVLFAAGRCAHCYWAWRHDQRRFKGQRRKTLLRDRGCLLCLEVDARRLVCHHVEPGQNREFATLCRSCHPRLHRRYHLPAFASPTFRHLYERLHGRSPQLELPFFTTDPPIQAALFADA